MRIISLTKLIQSLGVILVLWLSVAAEPLSKEGAARFLPAEIGNYKAISSVVSLEDQEGQVTNVVSAGQRDYRSSRGDRFTVVIQTTKTDSSAYAIYQSVAAPLASSRATRTASITIGTRSLTLAGQVIFFKGASVVSVKSKGRPADDTPMLQLAGELASFLDGGEGDVPVLVKHLPDWQQVETKASYAVDLAQLKSAVPNQAVIETISFEGGTEAVVAPYGPAQMVLVEFTTPQLATENDERIKAKVQQLWAQGLPAPKGYRRVGNYSGFVFNAATNEEANQLIDQVKYEQVVQWLGDNPYWLKQAQKEYTETTLGVLVTVIKTSGLAAMVCFGVGGFLGAVMFARRRARQANAEAYSDAGGMMRLNLDELSIRNEPAKLIGSGPSEKL